MFHLQCRRFLGQENLLEEEMTTTPVFLPEKFHEQSSLEGYSPRICKELDTTEQLSVHARRIACHTADKEVDEADARIKYQTARDRWRKKIKVKRCWCDRFIHQRGLLLRCQTSICQKFSADVEQETIAARSFKKCCIPRALVSAYHGVV